MSGSANKVARCFSVLSVIVVSQFANAEISGEWHFSLNVQGQTGTAKVSIEQVNDKVIKGIYVGQRFGTVEFTGTVKSISNLHWMQGK